MAEQIYFIMKNPKMQTFRDLDLPIFRVARGALCVEPKNLFLHKNFKIAKKFPKFFEIWAGGPQSSIMLSQRGFGQNLEWIGPFPPFSALLNHLLRILIFALQTCMRAQ